MMSTINDVAKYARVSVGTVSNYLNGKYVGTAKVQAIREAISALGYSPNPIARALKVKESQQIMLILPNISESTYSLLAESIINDLGQSGYQLRLEFTNDVVQREQALLEKCFSANYRAVLLCTCQPKNSELFERLMVAKPLIFLLRKPDKLSNYCYFGFDNYGIIYRITSYLLESGEHSLGLWTGSNSFSSERACIKAFLQAHSDMNYNVPERNTTVSLPSTKAVIFRHATDLFLSKNYPRVFIASSKLIADAITEAAYYQRIILNKNICVIALGDGSWSNAEKLYCNLSTSRSMRTLAQETCQYLRDRLESNGVYEQKMREINDDFQLSRLHSVLNKIQPVKTVALHKSGRKLRLMMPKDVEISCIPFLVPYISENIDADIILDEVPIESIVPRVLSDYENHRCTYDLVHLDNNWMDEVACGALLELNDYFQQRPSLRNDMVPNLLETVSSVNGIIYGAPSLFCSQMLFYRKDLFDDPANQASFYQLYGRKLQPPKTWFDYLLAARFFTRSINPDSPCKYGLTTGIQNAQMMLCEIYPRIWAYGGRVFDNEGNVCLYSAETLQGIRNYLECLQCAKPGYEQLTLPHLPTAFLEGDSAMMIAYDINASNLMNLLHESTIPNQVGFAQVPGKISAMGGWNFCINSLTLNIDLCYRFLDELFSPELAIPYTLLGGGSPLKNIVGSPDVISMYPWMQHTHEIFTKSRMRSVPSNKRFENPSESLVERILSTAIYAAIKKPDRLEDYLHTAEHELIQWQTNHRK